MRILLVVDGSAYSEVATRILQQLQLPAKTDVAVLTVVPETTFLGGITFNLIRGNNQARQKARETQLQQATELLSHITQTFKDSKFKVETLVRWGNPVEEILAEAKKRNASLIVMGAKGLTGPPDFPLGSVALKVMKYANTSVLLARPKKVKIKRESQQKSQRANPIRVLLATDGSKYANAVVQFLLSLPLPRRTEVIIITALQSHLEAWMKTPTLDLHNNQALLVTLQAAEEAEARKITDRAQKQFREKGYPSASVVVRGGASESIIAAAREYNPDIIALGCKGLTGIESFLLGSVAERVARYVDCSVLIGRSRT